MSYSVNCPTRSCPSHTTVVILDFIQFKIMDTSKSIPARTRGRTLGQIVAFIFLLLVLALFSWSYFTNGIVSLLLNDDIPAVQRTLALQETLLVSGPIGPIVYMAIVTAEVIVAPVPGVVLYAAGGLVFGGFVGGTLALFGNVLGAAICFKISKVLGRTVVESHIDADVLRKIQAVLDRRGFWIICFLRLNPFTSFDVVSYAAGLTRMTLWQVVLGTFLGILPLCYLQAYLGEAIFVVFPSVIYLLFALCSIYLTGFGLILWKLTKTRG